MHNITAYDKGLLIVFVGVITPPCAYHFCLVYGAKIMLNFARIAGYIKLFFALTRKEHDRHENSPGMRRVQSHAGAVIQNGGLRKVPFCQGISGPDVPVESPFLHRTCNLPLTAFGDCCGNLYRLMTARLAARAITYH